MAEAYDERVGDDEVNPGDHNRDDDVVLVDDLVTKVDFDMRMGLVEQRLTDLTNTMTLVQATLAGLVAMGGGGQALVAPSFTPEPFTGEKKMRTQESVDSWLHRWGVHFQFHPFPEDKKIQMVQGFLTGKALTWWKELRVKPTTWVDFEKDFRDEFLQAEDEYDIVPKFKHLDMSSMPFDTYLQKFRELQARATHMDAVTILGFFVDGLPDAYQLQVRNNRSKTLEDAIRYAKIYDETVAKKQPRKNQQPFTTHQSGPQHKRQFKNGKNSQTPAETQSQPQTSGDPNSKRAKKSEQTLLYVKEGRCFTCGQLGHIRSNCPQNTGKSKSKGAYLTEMKENSDEDAVQ